MKKQQLLFYLALIMSIMTIQGQNGFCEQFDQYAPTTLQGLGCPGIPVNNVLDNWGTINAGLKYQDTGSQNGAGDLFLLMDDGSCSNGSSWAYNSIDYSGNWIEMVEEEGCFCYDFKTFHIATGTLSGNSLRIYNGADPSSSSLVATFVLNIPIDASRGWVRICAPIDFSDSSGNLPSNSDGKWVINTASASDWDALISGVSGIAYAIDVAGGNEKFGIDNVCISRDCDSTLIIDPEPTNEGAYCCEGENLVDNGNFENGLNGITTSYTQTGATYPGEYDVVTAASNFNATITDHSFCEDPISYPTNNMFMVVNGKTQQSGSSVIWEQTVSGLEVGEEYKFCANFKDMEQCTFNIFPNITMRAGTNNTSQIINTDDSDPCDWKNMELCFTATSSSMNLQIELDETGNGDGNDLAIDDISLQQKLDPNYFISVQHQGNNNTITASLNTISTTDDVLLNAVCNFTNSYYWFVYKTTNPTAPFSSISNFAWGNSNGSWGSVSTGVPWQLTTNFNNYLQFNNNSFYVIGMYIPSCCESCYTESWEYQITYNNNRSAMDTPILSDEMKEDIKSRFVKSGGIKPENEIGNIDDESSLSIYPNPSKNNFTATILNATIKNVEIVSISGQVVYSEDLDEDKSEKLIDISKFSSGIYLVNVIDNNKKRYTAKLVKE